MHIETTTALILTALAAAIVLLLDRGDRLFPGLAVLAAGLEALIAFDIVKISVAKFRIDLILAALLVIAGGWCWSKSSTKSAIAAATVVVLVGLLQLLGGLRVLR
jgi:hypothetical protein